MDPFKRLRDFAAGLRSPEEDEEDASTGFAPVDTFIKKREERKPVQSISTPLAEAQSRLSERVKRFTQPALNVFGGLIDTTIRGGVRSLGTAVQVVGEKLVDIGEREKGPIGRAVGPSIARAGESLSRSFDTFNVPGYGQVEGGVAERRRNIAEGDTPTVATLKAAFNFAMEEPLGALPGAAVGLTGKFVVAPIAGALFRGAAKRIADEAASSIAKSTDETAIFSILNDDGFAAALPEYTKSNLARDLVGVTDPEEVARFAEDARIGSLVSRNLAENGVDPIRAVAAERAAVQAARRARAAGADPIGVADAVQSAVKPFTEYIDEAETAKLSDFVTGTRKDIEALQRQALELQRRVSNNSAARAAEIKRGREALINRLYTEARYGNMPREQAQAVARFVDGLSDDLVSDVGIRINARGDAQGAYEFGTSIVRLFRDGIEESGGRFDRTTIHELWHAISRHAGDDVVAAMRSDLAKARGKFAAKNPSLSLVAAQPGDIAQTVTKEAFEAAAKKDPALLKFYEAKVSAEGKVVGYEFAPKGEHYRLTNLDEWFAENLTDKTLSRFAEMDARSQGVFGFAKSVLRKMVDAVRRAFGGDAAGKFLDRVMARENLPRIREGKGLRARPDTVMLGKDPLPDGVTPSPIGQRVAADTTYDEAVRKESKDLAYGTASMEEALATAKRVVAEKGDEYRDVMARVLSPKEMMSDVDVVVAVERFKELDRQFAAAAEGPEKLGLLEELMRIEDAVAGKARTMGQATNATRMFTTLRSNPLAIETRIRRAAKKHPEMFEGDGAVDESVAKFRAWGDRVRAMPDGRPKTLEALKLERAAILETVPQSAWGKLSFFHTFNMLMSGRTFERNLIGNLLFQAPEYGASVAASAFDTLRSVIFRTPRTTSALNPVEMMKVSWAGARKGLSTGLDEARYGVSFNSATGKYELPGTPLFRDGTVGRRLQQLLDLELRVPDKVFYQAASDASLARQMKAAKATEPTEAMLEEAHLDGMYATFQDVTLLSETLGALRKGANKIGFGPEEARFGLGDLLMKFVKTPANLINRGLAYSPLGFLHVLGGLAKATFSRPARGAARGLRGALERQGEYLSGKRFVEILGRASVGTVGLTALGYKFGEVGIVMVREDSDADARASVRETGLGKYRINLSAARRYLASAFNPEAARVREGDDIVTYDWLQPMAISFTLGADYQSRTREQREGGDTLVDKVGAGLASAGVASLEAVNSVIEQGLFTGVRQVLTPSSDDTGILGGLAEAVATGVSSFVPALVKQSRQVEDPQKRSTYSDNWLERYLVNPVKNALPSSVLGVPNPFGSRSLPGVPSPVTGDMATYSPKGSGFFTRAWNAFANPSLSSTFQVPPELAPAFEVFGATGNKTVFPRVSKKTYAVNGEEVKLTAEEFHNHQLLAGTLSRRYINALAADPSFIEATDKEKITMMRHELDVVAEIARTVALGDRTGLSADAETRLVEFLPEDVAYRILDQIAEYEAAEAEAEEDL